MIPVAMLRYRCAGSRAILCDVTKAVPSHHGR